MAEFHPAPQGASSFEKTCFPAILGAGLILRLLVAFRAPCIEMDGTAYARIAEQFSKGLFGEALNNFFSPVYPLFVGLFHLVLPDVEIAGRLVSLLSGVALIWLAFLFSKRLFDDHRKALWVAALVAFHPYLISYSSQVLAESLVTLLFFLSVFAFYVGWQESRRLYFVASGFCLVLAYLTRPEYVVYCAPFALLLLWKRRVKDIAILILPVLVLGVLYMSSLHTETGTWMVSKRATLSPFVRLTAFLVNIPTVTYDFTAAIFPVFFLLALVGAVRLRGPYRTLAAMLVVFHILSLSFISHATKRYSVEFIPLMMIFTAEGIHGVRGYFKRPVPKRIASYTLAGTILLFGLLEPLGQVHHERALHKQAGRFLLQKGPGSVIAARLPLAAFYAKGRPVDLVPEVLEDKSPEGVARLLRAQKVDYVIVDEELEKQMPFLKDLLSGMPPVYSGSDKGAFVRVYRLS